MSQSSVQILGIRHSWVRISSYSLGGVDIRALEWPQTENLWTKM